MLDKDTSLIHYMLGSEKIDNDHLKIFELLYKIQTLLNEDKNIHSTLVELQHCLEQHINDENELMILSNYPFAKNHIASHNTLLDRYMKAYHYSSGASKWFMNEYYTKWKDHVDHYDRQLVEYLKTKLIMNSL